jgi:hypothetical protein
MFQALLSQSANPKAAKKKKKKAEKAVAGEVADDSKMEV